MADVPKLSKPAMARILSKVAVRVAGGNRDIHPVDMAASMACAIEYAAETLDVLRDSGLIDWEV